MKKERLLHAFAHPLWNLLNSQILPGSFLDDADRAYGSEKQHIFLQMQDGVRLSGWFFNRGADKPLVVMYVGNAMNAGDFLEFARRRRCCSFLLMNYRGFGDSEGTPNEELMVRDARHLLAWARQQTETQRVILVGFSIGTAVAVQVAAEEHPDRLVLICPFDSLAAAASDHIPVLPQMVLPNTFRSDLAIRRITCPLTIFAATEDTIVLPARTEALLKAYTDSHDSPPAIRRFHADHMDILELSSFKRELMRFLR